MLPAANITRHAHVRLEVKRFPLDKANTALEKLHAGRLEGPVVLEIEPPDKR